MRSTRRVLLVCLLFVLVVSLGNLVLAHPNVSVLDEVQKRGTIRVGMILTLPGFAARAPSGEFEGYEVDLAKALAETLKVKLEIVEATGPSRVPMLVSRKVDVVIANFTRTLERAQSIDFTDPYLTVGMQFIILAKRNDIKSVAMLNNAKFRIGMTRGGTPEQTVPKVLPKATIVKFEAHSDEFLSLRQGKVDACSEDNILSAGVMKENPGVFKLLPGMYSREEICFGVSKGDPDWLNWLNLFVHDINVSGRNNELFKKWFGQNLPKLIPEY